VNSYSSVDTEALKKIGPANNKSKLSRIWFLAGTRISVFATAPTLALGPTQPSIQWVPKAPSRG